MNRTAFIYSFVATSMMFTSFTSIAHAQKLEMANPLLDVVTIGVQGANDSANDGRGVRIGAERHLTGVCECGPGTLDGTFPGLAVRLDASYLGWTRETHRAMREVQLESAFVARMLRRAPKEMQAIYGIAGVGLYGVDPVHARARLLKGRFVGIGFEGLLTSNSRLFMEIRLLHTQWLPGSSGDRYAYLGSAGFRFRIR